MTEENVSWKEVESVFLQALDLQGEERERLLRERCAGDPAMDKAVRRLLAFDRMTSMAPNAPAVLADGADRTGSQIGSYRILSRIGSGGMGTVYKAERQDSFRKIVALKMLRFDLGDESGRARFRRERQILALLEHPYIARLLDGGGTPDGSPYIVMEYVEGVPLTVFTAHLPIPERIEVFRKVCDAVHNAHQRLVVHRDIKPGNILLQADGTPKLLDFGIAKLIEASEDEADAPQTVTRIMTPEYASPEQIRGEPVSTATDIYALGCVLYEVLTGCRAHRFASQDPLEIARVVCELEPPPPSSAGARELRGDLDNIVLKAIRKDPARRYGSATELSDDLARYLHGRTVLARPDTLRYRFSKYVRRNSWGLAAVAAVFAALLMGLILTQRQARIAETRFSQVRTLSRRLLFDVYDSVVRLPGSLTARQIVVTTALEYLNSLARDAAKDPDLAWEVAEAYTRVANVQGLTGISFGQRRDAIDTSSKALALEEALLRRGLLNVLQKEAMIRLYVDRVPFLLWTDRKVARVEAEKAVSLAAGLSPIPAGRARKSLGQVFAAEGNLDQAVSSYDEAIRLLRSAVHGSSPAPDQRSLQSALHMRARALMLQGRLNEAVSAFHESQALSERLLALDPSNPAAKATLAVDFEMLGTVLGLPDRPNLGRPAEGIAAIGKAFPLVQELRRLEPGSGELLRHEAILWGKRAAMERDPRAALASLENCGRLISAMADANEKDQMYTSYMADKAKYLLRLGRKDEARQTWRTLCRSTEEHVRVAPGDTVGLRSWGECLADLAEFELHHGTLSAGEPELKRAIEILRQADEAVPGDYRYLAARVNGLKLQARYLAHEGNAAEADRVRSETQALLDRRAAEHAGAKAIRELAARHRAGK